MNDLLQTGTNARLQVTFRDKTELSLGENATVTVDRYVFDPDASVGAAALNVTKGAFRLATGRLSAMRNKDIIVTTEHAALAVRGTDFWGGPIDGMYGVLLLSTSKLSVRNSSGDLVLSGAGLGTDIPISLKDGSGAPSRPYKWPADKVARALSQTNIGIGINPDVISAVIPFILLVVPDDGPDNNPRPRSP